MPWSRPTLTQLRDGAIQDVAVAPIRDGVTGQVVNPVLLQFDPLTILAKVMAGLAYEEYGYLDYIALQATPATATDEQALGWGALIGVTLKVATPAQAAVSYPGAAGTDVPAGTQLSRSDGALYATTADAIVPSSGTASLTVQAVTPGVAGTLALNAALSLASPIAGMGPGGTVTAVTAPGTDDETIDQLKVRYLQKYADPPQGGAATDYVEWALAVPGVTRAWVNPNGAGAGTVVLYTMWDQTEAENGGFPQGTDGGAAAETRTAAATGEQLVVANAIYPLRPVTALVYSVAPTALPIPFTLHTMTLVSAALRVAVAAAIDVVFLRLSSPLGMEMETSPFEAAIAAVPGMPDFTLTIPGGPIVSTMGYLPVRGAVTYG